MNLRAAGFALLATTTLSLTACGANENELGQDRGLDNGVQQTRFNSTTDFPLYNNGQNPNANDTGQNMDNYRHQNMYGNTTTRNAIDNHGENHGSYDGANSNIDGVRMNEPTREGLTGNRNINDRANDIYGNTSTNISNNNNPYNLADQIGDRITDQIDAIDDAYVLTNKNNAYVAVELNNRADGMNRRNGGNGNNVSRDIENQIRLIVKEVNEDVDNVYVSTDPDFVNLSNNYQDNVDNLGEADDGFFNEFGDMIDRIFPDAR
ncbi:YhcN/YlaJ family sporulation lipoprotein [Aquibacillus koreensis]|uniref:YhcN/YlaJ family sporulation lipoprotein n=1 Tax=Aquibacillus koreensis TaxID=279446 RepID=A0A9X3WIA0_9BACI|nr:YhcN/YlaJ family sporulation lipoprotein [Aquibacillus koreensis]MCT2535774.1 YhcN/YlaJ family sporulation lipoprotein [Aquibacillus koreensis]MDC3420230.1 YhcN/YlaJ family sporulation lipoprotein [Aquibacillus koreensis]